MREVRAAIALATTSGAGYERARRVHVNFGEPDCVEAPFFARFDLGEGLREGLGLRGGAGRPELVEDAEFHRRCTPGYQRRLSRSAGRMQEPNWLDRRCASFDCSLRSRSG
jgi:hypothetical protein